MNVRHALFAAAGAVALAANAQASEVGTSKKLGLGLGDSAVNSGLAGKLFLSDKLALQGVVGQYFGYGFGADVDAVQELGSLFKHEAGELVWGAGGGVGLTTWDTVIGYEGASSLSISGVGQLAWRFNALPLEVTAEWRPTFFLTSAPWLSAGSNVDIRGSGGAVRWLF
jgi:hypothetical protein